MTNRYSRRWWRLRPKAKGGEAWKVLEDDGPWHTAVDLCWLKDQVGGSRRDHAWKTGNR